ISALEMVKNGHGVVPPDSLIRYRHPHLTQYGVSSLLAHSVRYLVCLDYAISISEQVILFYGDFVSRFNEKLSLCFETLP
ncbi:MAG: hypothetical protein OQL27_06655, partial [Sedimenticola sp.]|nr:hypothetical protein [Sedimenticola sp.]